ncbi:IDH1 [Candida albicans]
MIDIWKSRQLFYGIDLCLARETTEDEYSVSENQLCPGAVEFLKIMTKSKSYIFAEYAFDFVMKSNKELVTAIHKSIFLKLGYGLVR